MKGPQTWQMLSSYGICSEGQNQVNVRVQLVGPAQGRGGVRVSHTSRGCAKFSHRVLFTRAFEEFGLDGDGENLWPLRVGKAGLGMKKIFHDD